MVRIRKQIPVFIQKTTLNNTWNVEVVSLQIQLFSSFALKCGLQMGQGIQEWTKLKFVEGSL